MANSKIKQILVGTTTYDIEDASAAKLASDNTFTGTNTFKTENSTGLFRTLINKSGVSVGGGPKSSGIIADTTYGYNGIKWVNNVHDTYDYAFPRKSGTFALTDDIDVKAAGNNTFTGINTFKKYESSEASSSSEGRIIIHPTPGSPKLSVEQEEISNGIAITSGTEIGPESIRISDNGMGYDISMTHDGFKVSQGGVYTEYWIGSISHNTDSGTKRTLSLPNKSGTLALTDDIDVKAAGNNKFTGSNTFTKNATFGDINASTGTAISTYGAIQFYNGAFNCGQLATGYYDDLFKLVYKKGDEVVKFPYGRSGTLALNEDLANRNSPMVWEYGNDIPANSTLESLANLILSKKDKVFLLNVGSGNPTNVNKLLGTDYHLAPFARLQFKVKSVLYNTDNTVKYAEIEALALYNSADRCTHGLLYKLYDLGGWDWTGWGPTGAGYT